MLFDLFQFEIEKVKKGKFYKFITPAVAIIFTMSIGYCYAGQIIARFRNQYNFIRGGGASFQETYGKSPIDYHIEEVKMVTKGSKKVTFVSQYDSFYCYEGGYIPQGYYSFAYSFLFLKDAVDFWNMQLNKGYYLVIPKDEFRNFVSSLVSINHDNITYRSKHFIVIFKPELVN